MLLTVRRSGVKQLRRDAHASAWAAASSRTRAPGPGGSEDAQASSRHESCTPCPTPWPQDDHEPHVRDRPLRADRGGGASSRTRAGRPAKGGSSRTKMRARRRLSGRDPSAQRPVFACANTGSTEFVPIRRVVPTSALLGAWRPVPRRRPVLHPGGPAPPGRRALPRRPGPTRAAEPRPGGGVARPVAPLAGPDRVAVRPRVGRPLAGAGPQGVAAASFWGAPSGLAGTPAPREACARVTRSRAGSHGRSGSHLSPSARTRSCRER